MWRTPILISYAYRRGVDWDLIKAEASAGRFILIDCGAFTAFRCGKKIDFNEWLSWVKEVRVMIPSAHILALDEIGDAVKTRENFKRIIAAGISVIPIFTRGSSVEHLQFYMQHSSYIALGGLREGGKNNLGYAKWFHRIVNEQSTGTHVHWLGFHHSDAVRYFKPYSLDLSSFARASRFGILDFWDGRCFKCYRRPTITSDELNFIISRVHTIYKIDVCKLKSRQGWYGGNSTVSILSALSWVRFARDTFDRVGTRICAAITSSRFLVDRIIYSEQLLSERSI